VKTAELVQQLEKVPLGRMYQASQKAMVRLHLYFTGQTHEMLLDFGERARGIILKQGGSEGKLDGIRGYAAQQELMRAWGDVVDRWARLLTTARKEAGAIPFGVLALMHERLIAPLASASAGSLRLMSPSTEGLRQGLAEAAGSGPAAVFEPQLRRLLDVAAEYLYGDGLNLSMRIWSMDRDTRDGINAVIMNGVANGASAWDLAEQLEQFLGAGRDCPRWTSTRLYGRTKSEIAAGDLGGLLSGDECDGSGVAYNALRLARTELQKIHALATDRVLAMQPWVELEQCNLSPAHPEPDECDDVVNGGEKNDGRYPVGTIEYPLHPNCLCYKTAVLMDSKAFTARLKAWMRDEEAWAEMDAYAEGLGVGLGTSMLEQPVVQALAVWLMGGALETWLK